MLGPGRLSPRTALIASVGAALVLLVPTASAAGATTYCVKKPACVAAGGTDVSGPATGATIQNAVTLANDGDRIELGPVTFTDVNVTGNPARDVALAGDGIGRTVLVEGSVANGTAVLWNNDGDVSDFTVNLPDSGSTGIQANRQLDRVEVTAAPTVTSVTGVQTEPGGTLGTELSASRILLPIASGNIAIRQVPTAHVQDSELEGEYGILLEDVGPGRQAARLRIRANNGVWALANGFTLSLSDSIIRVVGAGFGVAANGFNSTSAGVSANGLTIVGDGTAGATGVRVTSGTSAPATLSLSGSVIDNVPQPLSCSSSVAGSSLTTDWSSYQQNISSCGSGTVTHGPNNLNPPPNPRFVDPARGDFHLRFDSPLIDRGQSVGSGGADAFGGIRYRDGNGDSESRVDIGGAEYQRLPPILSATAPASGAAGAPLLFQATASDPDPGDSVSLRWSFDDGAILNGTAVSHAFAAAGARTATATATDSTGLTASASRHVQALDKTAARITGLRMVPKKFARGKRLPRISRRARVGSSIRFRLSEAARVTLQFERIRPGRKVGKRCLAPTPRRSGRPRCKRYVAVRTRRSFAAKAGLNKIRFQGRLNRKRTLKPGRYRLTLGARDGAGNRSSTKRVAFTLLAHR